MERLSEKQMQDVATQARVARGAAEESAKQLAILWEARLNLALAMDDPDAVKNAAAEARAVAYLDNCNCTNPGGVLA